MKIYLASSWRNEGQPLVVRMLRNEGHEVYDFRNPVAGNDGFHWSSVDGGWKQWTPERYRTALSHPIAEEGFRCDFEAMKWADAFVLLMPCGRSAHLELGWAIGAGKKTAILLADEQEPELMYKLADAICLDIGELFDWLEPAPWVETATP